MAKPVVKLILIGEFYEPIGDSRGILIKAIGLSGIPKDKRERDFQALADRGYGVEVVNAAAPELLEACLLAVKWADETPSPYRDWDFVRIARAAIAKAIAKAGA